MPAVWSAAVVPVRLAFLGHSRDQGTASAAGLTHKEVGWMKRWPAVSRTVFAAAFELTGAPVVGGAV